MVVDSSAIVAILLDEPGSDRIARAILSTQAIMAAPNLVEVLLVLRKFLEGDTEGTIWECIDRFRITVVPFSAEHAWAAGRAFEQFGKGRHPADLNFGDCIAYAVAKSSGQPLLYTGNDFRLTDVATAELP